MVACLSLLIPALSVGTELTSSTPAQSDTRIWQNLLKQAADLGLPTAFLNRMPPDFVRMEFDELRSFAAEYHPDEHRMVLNRTLSFNAAGGTLRPLNRMTHKELETLYHELFHAYMDFVNSTHDNSLIAFARLQQQCRYQHVLIAPVPQRKNHTEERFLSEVESWEALNETWAVFIGWTVWTQLELKGRTRPGDAQRSTAEGWLKRLKKADRDADLRGYYEPEDSTERAVARKRFLAPEFRLSPQEIAQLMQEALDLDPQLISRSMRVLEGNRLVPKLGGSC
ncbi:MAG: hypothetical protein ACT4OO_02800 [Nitrospiraceae bacterium]